jgi:hypothetical protein
MPSRYGFEDAADREKQFAAAAEERQRSEAGRRQKDVAYRAQITRIDPAVRDILGDFCGARGSRLSADDICLTVHETDGYVYYTWWELPEALRSRHAYVHVELWGQQITAWISGGGERTTYDGLLPSGEPIVTLAQVLKDATGLPACAELACGRGMGYGSWTLKRDV